VRGEDRGGGEGGEMAAYFSFKVYDFTPISVIWKEEQCIVETIRNECVSLPEQCIVVTIRNECISLPVHYIRGRGKNLLHLYKSTFSSHYIRRHTIIDIAL
jgi:hypothetical protein